MTSEYQPDRRLSGIYTAANSLDREGLESLCPAYVELSENTARYRDAERIGCGALKEVFRTYDAHTQRWVAMARLRKDRGEDFYDLFIHEAWLVSSLSHPNIIKVHDTGVDAAGRPFFTMDLKSNTTLADLVEGERPAGLNALLQVFGKVCDAVAYAHSRGMIHLDLKPENIQADAFGEVLVCDWGLAKVIGDYDEDETSSLVSSLGGMTLLGQIKGSPGFMAPEQVDPEKPKTVETDVYALGCILYYILTGQPPFRGTGKAVLEATAASRVRSPRLQFPQRYIPASLDAVVMKAMARSPADRYRSVPELQAEIEKYAAGYATQAEDCGFFREARLFIGRNRVPTLISVAAFFILGVMGVLFVQYLSEQKRAAAQLNSEYTSFVEETQASRDAVAYSLADSVRRLVEFAINDHPVETVEQCRNILDTASEQGPGITDALGEHFALDCLVLDHQSALERSDRIEDNFQYQRYIRFAEAFPDFDFSRTKRPSLEQLIDYLQRARTLDPAYTYHIERVLSYDSAVRRDKSGYAPVVEAALQYHHKGPDHLTLSFYEQTSVVSLWSDLDVRLILARHHGKCMLRFLPFRFLELDIAGSFPLADLDGMPIEALDVSRCPELKLSYPVELPQLRSLVVRAGQFSKETLRSTIRSNAAYEIIEVDPASWTSGFFE